MGVIDRFRELDLLIKTARELSIRPHIGIRARLTARGAGKWVESSGERSKFGLSAVEIVDVIKRLREAGMLDCLQLLHFHLGIQITDIRRIKEALREGARVFVELKQLGAGMKYCDVGGGLGVDYDGSRTNFHSSKNYSTQEYANDVVSFVQEACDEAEVPHPDIVTESGRALVSHASVLVFDVLSVDRVAQEPTPRSVREDEHRVVRELYEVWENVSERNVLESYHDAMQLKDEATSLFSLGYLNLEERARIEEVYWCCFQRILDRVHHYEGTVNQFTIFQRIQ